MLSGAAPGIKRATTPRPLATARKPHNGGMTHDDALSGLSALRQALSQARQSPSGATAFSDFAQQHEAVLQALPPAFARVWADLLNRLSSSALFNEDSCSFNQSEVFDAFALWLDKAEARLQAEG